MRILYIHSYYQQAGGEDTAFEAECRLMESRGHQVLRYTRRNAELSAMSALRLCAVTLWNRTTYREVSATIRRERPDIVHCHNLFPLISPSVCQAASAEGTPVVMTLHNYRLACPNAVFFRGGQVCEACLDRPVPWPAITHSCYRGSRRATGVVVLSLVLHRVLGTWRRHVSRFIALTEFGRAKLIQVGLPAERIDVKPPPVFDPAVRRESAGEYALFVGRLSPEKGIDLLLNAWSQLTDIPLKVAGTGSLAGRARQAAGSMPAIELLGWQTGSQIAALLANARLLVFPSQWYEGLPLTLVEAYASGVPVAASRLGAMPEVIEDGGTGVLFQPDEPAGLRQAVRRLWDNPHVNVRMGARARTVFAEKYAPDVNYRQLMDIYARARGGARAP